jgi:hypothetical protein
MMTFGLAMIVANVAFVSPRVIRSLSQRWNADPWLAELERSATRQLSEEPSRVPVAVALHQHR